MQSDYAYAAAACFSEREIDEVAGEAAAPILRLHVDVEQIAARGGARIERMRRPVEEEQTGSADDGAAVFAEPADVAAFLDHFCDPRFVRLSHNVEYLIVAAACIDKHAAAMMGDEGSVGSSRQPGSQHDEQYKTERSSEARGRTGYDGVVTRTPQFAREGLHAGVRLAVAVSGGADSVGLLRVLADAAPEMGLVLSVAHVHHGIRGADADEDAQFVEELAGRLGLAFCIHRANTPAKARERRQSLEEAGREDRYTWFRALMAEGKADAVATAHTLDDQAETVLHRLLRGAWTEGLGGIHPVVLCVKGAILRPLLETRRAEIRAWLEAIAQPWREDATNQDQTFTRNRIRQALLPQMADFNPRIAEQLAHMAELARDEEAWWEGDLARVLPSLVLPGKPVRGGGRAVSTHPDEGSVGMELERLRALAPAMRRRVLRAAAAQMGFELNFEQTARLMAMCGPGAVRREQLTGELRAERSARELRLVRASDSVTAGQEAVEVRIPGEAAGLGVIVRTIAMAEGVEDLTPATLRSPRVGDRVKVRHSRGAKSLKEIFERMQVEAEARNTWPLLEWQGRIVWMKDVPLEVEPPIPFRVEVISSGND